MCGIIGYRGKSDAINVCVNGLEKLSYRGYDSCGLGYIRDNILFTKKSLSSPSSLLDVPVNVETCIGHTRWSTHGEVSLKNCHPFLSQNGSCLVVHNGVIDNFQELRKEHSLPKNSDTDSEVAAHLLENFMGTHTLRDAVVELSKCLKGSYALLFLLKNGSLVALRSGSPLVCGYKSDQYFFSSDPLTFEENSDVFFIPNDSFVILESDLQFYSFSNEQIQIEPTKLIHQSYEGKKNYETYMKKEIYEQPDVINYILKCHLPEIKGNRIILLGCGSSYYCCMLGKYFIEKYSSLDVSLEYASDFCFRDRNLPPSTVIAVSQSGETFDVLESVEYCRNLGFPILSICNSNHSSLVRLSTNSILLGLGYEIGVCATKSFIGQLICFLRIALSFSDKNYDQELSQIPSLVRATIQLDGVIQKIAEKYYQSPNMLYLGRTYGMCVALEGALKMKEVAYTHAEAIHASELKHGNIALIDENMVCVVIGSKSTNEISQRILTNVSEIKSRRGKIISILSSPSDKIVELSDEVILLPNVEGEIAEEIQTLLSVIPLQLLAYYIARFRGLDTDKPRNLAKCCTTA